MGTKPVGSVRYGEWSVQVLEAGGFALDGGSMFGSAPRGWWERRIAPDAEHRIPLAMRLVLLRRESTGEVVLVDTGIGDKFDDGFRERFAVRRPPGEASRSPLELALAGAGRGLADVTHVVLTHLHFDHAGGVSRRDATGTIAPTFPTARHFLQRDNFETAVDPNPREQASYLDENVAPLREVELELLAGEEEILPGLRVIPSQGHTRGMQLVRLEGGGRVVYFLADLAPTHHHVHIPITMGYDLCPREIMREKVELFERAAKEDATFLFEHDPEVVAGTIANPDGRKYRLERVGTFE